MRPLWSDMGTHVATFIVLSGVACTVGVEERTIPSPEALHWTQAPVLYQSWSQTAALIRDPETRKKVDALSALSMKRGILIDGTEGIQPTIEGEQIGEGGSTSSVWLAFQAVVKVIAPADAIALLRHENPAVRGYFAGHVASRMPDEAPDLLYPLFADATLVGERGGCTGRTETIAHLAFDEISRVPAETNLEREAFFEIVIDDKRLPVTTRGEALSYLAQIDSDKAHPHALAAARDADAGWRHEGIHALGVAGFAVDAELVAAGATSTDWHEREAVAEALEHLDTPVSCDALVPLMHDSMERVREVAASSYAAQTCARDDVLATLLTGNELAMAVGGSLAQKRTLHALQLLELALMRENTPLGGFELESLLSAVGAPGVPVMRRLLASRSSYVRDNAAQALAKLR